MKKPVLFGSLAIVVLIITIVAVFFFLQKRNAPLGSEQKQEVVEKVENIPSKTTKKYTDEAGFQFDYPDDLTLSKKESTSSAVYSEVAASSQKVAGSLSFIVEDTKTKTPGEWITKNLSASASATKEVKLGNLVAKEIMVTGKIVTVAIDQGILFRFDVMPEKDLSYWQSVYNTILSSFSFVAQQNTSVSSGTSDAGESDVSVEEDTIE